MDQQDEYLSGGGRAGTQHGIVLHPGSASQANMRESYEQSPGERQCK